MDKITDVNTLDAVVRYGDIFYLEEKTDKGTKVTLYIALPIPKGGSYMLGLQLFDIESLCIWDDEDYTDFTRRDILDKADGVLDEDERMFFLGSKESYKYNISIERSEV